VSVRLVEIPTKTRVGRIADLISEFENDIQNYRQDGDWQFCVVFLNRDGVSSGDPVEQVSEDPKSPRCRCLPMIRLQSTHCRAIAFRADLQCTMNFVIADLAAV
jgi:hypothetical protein